MLVKILGGIDLIAGIMLLFSGLGFPTQVLLFFGIVLIIKSSFGMLKDFASWVDFLGGVTFLLLMIINIPFFIGLIVGILLIQKGGFSFF